MRFLVDECLFRQIVEQLNLAGYDTIWARDECHGFDDDKLLAKAVSEDRILVSEDRDFGTLTIRFRKPAIGIVIVAASEFSSTLDDIAIHTRNVIAAHASSLRGTRTTIEPGRVRPRKLPEREC